MSCPVDALRAARRVLRDGGSVLVAAERVDDEFTPPAAVLERHAYGWSVISFLPSAMGDPTAATGAVMRPSTLRGYATAAGFDEIDVLAIETGRFWFYRLILSLTLRPRASARGAHRSPAASSEQARPSLSLAGQLSRPAVRIAG